MEKFRVNGCCCCFNLETGVIIIGAFELFIGISSIIFGGAHIGGDPLYGSVSLIEGGKYLLSFQKIQFQKLKCKFL